VFTYLTLSDIELINGVRFAGLYVPSDLYVKGYLALLSAPLVACELASFLA